MKPSQSQSTVRILSDRPAAAMAISFALGTAVSRFCNEYSFGCIAAACLALICSAYLALRGNRLLLSFVLGLTSILLCGLLMAFADRDAHSEKDLRFLLSGNAFQLNEPVMFEGCIAENGYQRGEDSITTIELRGFVRRERWVACRGAGILRMPASGSGGPQTAGGVLKRGDRVRGWATWNVPRNYRNPGSADRAGDLARKGVFVIGRVKSLRLLESIPGDCSNPWIKMANSVRDRVRTCLEPLRNAGRGRPAAILASLVIGDYSGLDNHVREIFQNSGTFHVLVISALHVAWIAGLVLLLGKSLRLPERLSHLLAALTILMFAFIVGFQASISRCLWMFILCLTGRIIMRRADPVNILFAAALILLATQPAWLFETGFQLSFLSVLAIALTAVPILDGCLRPLLEPLRHSGRPSRLFLKPGMWHRCGRSLRTRCEILVEAVADPLPPVLSDVLLFILRGAASIAFAAGSVAIVSVSIQIWLEPLLACYFNRLSWVGPLANVIIVPFSSLVLLAGIAASLAGNLPCCGGALIQLAGSLASMLLQWTERITTIPGAWQRCPTPPMWSVLAVLVLLFGWNFLKWRHLWFPYACAVILVMFLSIGSVPIAGDVLQQVKHLVRIRKDGIWRTGSPILRLTFLDVGQGDSTVIGFPDGRHWIIDAGGLRMAPSQEDSAYAFDIGEAVVSRFLWQGWNTKLDRLILSHSDLDHSGGMAALLKNFRVKRFDHSPAPPDEILMGILRVARERHVETRAIHSGMQETISGVTVRVLHPAPNTQPGSTNENSLVLAFSFKRFSALLTGDLEKSREAEFLERVKRPRTLLLKVSHHGSRWGTSDAFLDKTSPLWAVISAGRNNPFGHPSQEVMFRLLRHGARPLLTVDEGAIAFETDGEAYQIKSYVRGVLEKGVLRQS